MDILHAKERAKPKTLVPPMCPRCGRNSHTKYYCKDHKVSCRHCKSQMHASCCCAFIPRATLTSNGETSDTASTNRQSQQTNLPSSPHKQKKKSKNQERQKREYTQKPQAQQNDNGACTAPHQANRNTQPPQQGQQQYFYPPPPQQVPEHSQIVVQQDSGTATVLRQMAQLHQQHFETSQTQTKALENIASASSFTSTVSCIPIYDGKDKDACTEWLQRCKEASYYTGYNFRLALLQRSSQDMAKVIRSLDEELSHDKLIEEIMCASFRYPQHCSQPLMNCPIYASNLAKTSSSTSTSAETSTGGAPRSCHVKKHTSSHSASSALHCKTQ